MFEVAHLIPLYPELLLCLSVFGLLMYGAFAGNDATDNVLWMSVAALIMAGSLIMEQYGVTLYVFDDMFRIDDFIRFAKLLVIVSAVLALLLTQSWLSQQATRKFEYPILILLATTGLLLMLSANDLLAVYMSLELASLSLYVMAAFDRDNARASEAGLKYFILGSLASGMMLFGTSLIYGFAGSIGFADIASVLEQGDTAANPGLIVGLIFVIVGFCFKISAVPFHMWTPDVYEGTPTPVVTYFAAAPKIAAILLFARVLHQPFAEMIEQWQQIVILISILSMLLGAFAALGQTNIKRLLAYSSIGHMGYALMGIAAGTEAGIQGLLIYLALYLFMSIGAFGFVMILRRGEETVEDIHELGGLSNTNPKAAFFMSLMLFSMAGIPPLAGFFGKMYVFLSAVEAGLYVLAVIGVLSSVVAAYYYIKIVKIMYFDETKKPFDGTMMLSARMVLSLCAIVVLVFFLIPTTLIQLSGVAAAAMM